MPRSRASSSPRWRSRGAVATQDGDSSMSNVTLVTSSLPGAQRTPGRRARLFCSCSCCSCFCFRDEANEGCCWAAPRLPEQAEGLNEAGEEAAEPKEEVEQGEQVPEEKVEEQEAEEHPSEADGRGGQRTESCACFASTDPKAGRPQLIVAGVTRETPSAVEAVRFMWRQTNVPRVNPFG